MIMLFSGRKKGELWGENIGAAQRRKRRGSEKKETPSQKHFSALKDYNLNYTKKGEFKIL